MRQFEYQILNASDLSETALNELGKAGWELVCSTQSIVYGSCLVLKREVGIDGGRSGESG
jgi:hypothetical protein